MHGFVCIDSDLSSEWHSYPKDMSTVIMLPFVLMTSLYQQVEPYRSTYMQIFFSKYVQYSVSIFSYDFLNNILFYLAYFIIRVKNIIHIAYKMCIDCLFYW